MTWRNFAPRLGIAYLLKDAGNFTTVLRTGGGLFYSTETGYGVGLIDYPNSTSTTTSGLIYPFTQAQLTPPPIGVVTAAGLASQAFIGFNPHLAVPRVWQWNVSIEQRLGKDQSLTVGYVGSAGRRLFFSYTFLPASGNFEDVSYTDNASASDYNSLQMKFQRHVARGLQVLTSYTWSHSIDSASTNVFTDVPSWGNSDFDTRHSVSAAGVYNIPGVADNRWLKATTSGWELSTNFQARTAEPVVGLFAASKFNAAGILQYTEANLVPGVPVYLHGPQYPGGLSLNRAAFVAPPAGTTGDVPRNAFRGLDFWQDDMSLQRKFAFGEKAGLLRLRVDAFNLLNHPNFASLFVRNLTTSPSFGQATSMLTGFVGGSSTLYNSGGPRSLQVSLRYEF